MSYSIDVNVLLVEFVTASPALRITHIPVLVDRTDGEYGSIFGHISRQNPQIEAIEGRHAAVVVFRGAHGYVSRKVEKLSRTVSR